MEFPHSWNVLENSVKRCRELVGAALEVSCTGLRYQCARTPRKVGGLERELLDFFPHPPPGSDSGIRFRLEQDLEIICPPLSKCVPTVESSAVVIWTKDSGLRIAPPDAENDRSSAICLRSWCIGSSAVGSIRTYLVTRPAEPIDSTTSTRVVTAIFDLYICRSYLLSVDGEGVFARR